MKKTGILFLFKFGKYEYMKELMKGKIYCNNLKYYSDLELKIGDKSMGDKNEGKHIGTEEEIYIIDPITKEIVKKYTGVRSETEYAKMRNMPVYCMTAISEEDLEKVVDDKEEYYIFRPKEILTNISKESYWESAVIIEDKEEFFKRVENACKTNKLNIIKKYVNYTNINKNYYNRELDVVNNIYNVAFWKDNSYSFQHEFRFAFSNKRVEDKFELQIGDISDIARLMNEYELKEFIYKNYKVIIDSKEL